MGNSLDYDPHAVRVLKELFPFLYEALGFQVPDEKQESFKKAVVEKFKSCKTNITTLQQKVLKVVQEFNLEQEKLHRAYLNDRRDLLRGELLHFSTIEKQLKTKWRADLQALQQKYLARIQHMDESITSEEFLELYDFQSTAKILSEAMNA